LNLNAKIISRIITKEAGYMLAASNAAQREMNNKKTNNKK
jgi:hypothetical protein